MSLVFSACYSQGQSPYAWSSLDQPWLRPEGDEGSSRENGTIYGARIVLQHH